MDGNGTSLTERLINNYEISKFHEKVDTAKWPNNKECLRTLSMKVLLSDINATLC